MRRTQVEVTKQRSAATRPDSDQDLQSFLDSVETNLQYAFQPIVSVDTGIAHGYEALLRGVERLGAASIPAFFDDVHDRGWLSDVDRVLLRKALRAVRTLPSETARLFFNVDARLLSQGAPFVDEIVRELAANDIDPERFCLEIPESQDVVTGDTAVDAFHRLNAAGAHLALDDFGQGYSRLRLIHELAPHYVKVDRYFIEGVHSEPKKRLFLSRLVDVMHVFGIRMVAEGVETEEEFRACRDLGFDMVQGYLIQRPTQDVDHVLSVYPGVAKLNRRERRNRSTDMSLVRSQMEELPALAIDLPMIEVFEAFRRNRHISVFPVIDEVRAPVGVVRDSDLKAYAFSPYGRELMVNKAFGLRLRDLVEPCPTASIDMPIEKILEIFAHRSDAPGLLLAEQGRYVGFLNSTALLKVLHEKTVAAARDQNPLTRLPGNLSIQDWVLDAIPDRSSSFVLAYFDFDSFKPFNDTYGFRNGDWAIQLFAELLQKRFTGEGVFIGHIGGDDFFAGFRAEHPGEVASHVAELVAQFAFEVESFYDAATRERGYIEARGRDGELRRFGCLTCSVGLLALPADRADLGADTVMDEVARLKKQAKLRSSGIAVSTLR